MCSARVDIAHILFAFSTGQDAVFVGGCHLGDCHYITNGNYNALSVVTLCKKLLERIGLDPNRLRLEWVSAGEGIRFGQVMNDFGKTISRLGPIGKSEGIDEKTLEFRLEALLKLVPYMKTVLAQRLTPPLSARVSGQEEENYRNYYNSDEVNNILEETIFRQLAVTEILALLGRGPKSTSEIATTLGLTPSEVSKLLAATSKHRLVRYDERGKRFALP
jgi:coenzyme F420-reducing hydrogenase delta subunit